MGKLVRQKTKKDDIDVLFYNVDATRDRIVINTPSCETFFDGVIVGVDSSNKYATVKACITDGLPNYMHMFSFSVADNSVNLIGISKDRLWTCFKKSELDDDLCLNVSDFVMLSNYTIGVVKDSRLLPDRNMRIYKISIRIDGKEYVRNFFTNGRCIDNPLLSVIHKFDGEYSALNAIGAFDKSKGGLIVSYPSESTSDDDTPIGRDGQTVFIKQPKIGVIKDDDTAWWCSIRRVYNTSIDEDTLEYVSDIVPMIPNLCNQSKQNIDTSNHVTEEKDIDMTEKKLFGSSADMTVIEEAKLRTKKNAIMVAKMTVGRTMLTQLNKAAEKTLPIFARGYVKEYSAYTNVVVSLGTSLLLTRIYPDNERVEIICECMELAANAIFSEKGANVLNSIIDKVDIPAILFDDKKESKKKRMRSMAPNADASADD